MIAIEPKRPVIIVSSHVAYGGVGNRAAVFALERLGHGVIAMPTVLLPFHPGHGRGARIVTPSEEFSALLGDLEKAPWLGDVGAVLSGYLGDGAQAAGIGRLVAAVKRARPDALYLCDPVLGDAGRRYMPVEIMDAIASTLLPLADILTPNRFELELLSGATIADEADLVEAVRALVVPEVAVTSAFEDGDTLTSLVVRSGEVARVTHPRLPHAPHGTGDLFAALYLAARMAGGEPTRALASAANRVYRLAALAAGRDELPLAAGQELLLEGANGEWTS